VIGKVLRGTDVRRLLYYLYGPGKAYEHTDPHLIAGFCDPAYLEPERRPGGSRDFGRLAGLLALRMPETSSAQVRVLICGSRRPDELVSSRRSCLLRHDGRLCCDWPI
jgi:hypothetical protein